MRRTTSRTRRLERSLCVGLRSIWRQRYVFHPLGSVLIRFFLLVRSALVRPRSVRLSSIRFGSVRFDVDPVFPLTLALTLVLTLSSKLLRSYPPPHPIPTLPLTAPSPYPPPHTNPPLPHPTPTSTPPHPTPPNPIPLYPAPPLPRAPLPPPTLPHATPRHVTPLPPPTLPPPPPPPPHPPLTTKMCQVSGKAEHGTAVARYPSPPLPRLRAYPPPVTHSHHPTRSTLTTPTPP